MFPSLSAVRAFHIFQLMRAANRQSHYDCVGHNVHEHVAVILYVFSIGPECAFIIIKSCSKFRFSLTNIRSFPTYSTFQEINELLTVTVKYPTLNFKCLTIGFGRKVSVSHIKS